MAVLESYDAQLTNSKGKLEKDAYEELEKYTKDCFATLTCKVANNDVLHGYATPMTACLDVAITIDDNSDVPRNCSTKIVVDPHHERYSTEVYKVVYPFTESVLISSSEPFTRTPTMTMLMTVRSSHAGKTAREVASCMGELVYRRLIEASPRSIFNVDKTMVEVIKIEAEAQ